MAGGADYPGAVVFASVELAGGAMPVKFAKEFRAICNNQ
jgi:hypothetical protein